MAEPYGDRGPFDEGADAGEGDAQVEGDRFAAIMEKFKVSGECTSKVETGVVNEIGDVTHEKYPVIGGGKTGPMQPPKRLTGVSKQPTGQRPASLK